MGADQAGDDRPAAGVHHGGALGRGDLRAGPDGDDLRALDDEGPVLDGGAGDRVDPGAHEGGGGRIGEEGRRGERREDEGEVPSCGMANDGGSRCVHAIQTFHVAPCSQDVADGLLPHAFVAGAPSPILHVPDDHTGLRQGFSHRSHERTVEGLFPKSPVDEHDGGRALFGGQGPFLDGKVKVGHVVRPIAPTDFLAHDGRWWGRGVNLSAQGETRRRSRGNRTVSRTFFAPVNTMRMRSTPSPHPAWGGTPWRNPAT